MGRNRTLHNMLTYESLQLVHTACYWKLMQIKTSKEVSGTYSCKMQIQIPVRWIGRHSHNLGKIAASNVCICIEITMFICEKCTTWSTYGAIFYASIIWPYKSQPQGVVQWNIHYHKLTLVIKMQLIEMHKKQCPALKERC